MNDNHKCNDGGSRSVDSENQPMAPVEGVVAGWQNHLKGMLTRMEGYLLPGHLVTFERMQPEERSFFEGLHARVTVPEGAAAIFLPESVTRQSMAAHPRATGLEASRKPTDAGVVLASRKGDCRRILNAVFALEPFVPAVDIYENGTLLAGYMYPTIDACIQELSTVMRIYLGSRHW